MTITVSFYSRNGFIDHEEGYFDLNLIRHYKLEQYWRGAQRKINSAESTNIVN